MIRWTLLAVLLPPSMILMDEPLVSDLALCLGIAVLALFLVAGPESPSEPF